MSYSVGLGKVLPETWGRYSAETDEAYVFYMTVPGPPIIDREDLRTALTEIGKCVNLSSAGAGDPSVRGIVYRQIDENSYSLATIVTFGEYIVRLWDSPDEKEMLDCIIPRLVARGIDVSGATAQWYQFTDSGEQKRVADEWLSMPIIWSYRGDEGTPTESWKRFRGLYTAQEDFGAMGDPSMIERVKSDEDPLGPPPSPPPGRSNLPWILGGIAIIALAYKAGKEKG